MLSVIKLAFRHLDMPTLTILFKYFVRRLLEYCSVVSCQFLCEGYWHLRQNTAYIHAHSTGLSFFGLRMECFKSINQSIKFVCPKIITFTIFGFYYTARHKYGNAWKYRHIFCDKLKTNSQVKFRGRRVFKYCALFIFNFNVQRTMQHCKDAKSFANCSFQHTLTIWTHASWK